MSRIILDRLHIILLPAMVELTGRWILNVLLVFDAVYFGGRLIEPGLGTWLSVVKCLFWLANAHAF